MCGDGYVMCDDDGCVCVVVVCSSDTVCDVFVWWYSLHVYDMWVVVVV